MVLMAVSNRIHCMIYTLRGVALCILVSTAFLYATTPLLAQEGSGMLCVAPLPKPVCSADVCLWRTRIFLCVGQCVCESGLAQACAIAKKRKHEPHRIGINRESSSRALV